MTSRATARMHPRGDREAGRFRSRSASASTVSGFSRTATLDHETRERLLDAAETLFADRGFKNVTVREICLAARANVAAINYHFGDKLGLYREVLQSAIDAMRASSDAARQAGEGQGPAEQLRRSSRACPAQPGHTPARVRQSPGSRYR